MTTALTGSSAGAVARELFGTPEGRRDPYPRYHRLRELEPVYRDEGGMWFLSSYEFISAALRDPRLGKDYPRQMAARFGASWREHPCLTRGETSMLNLDGPAHARLRRLVVKSFSKRAMEDLRPAIEKIVGDLLDPFAEAGGGDLVTAVNFPMPIRVIGELLGVPEEDRPGFRRWTIDLVAVLELNPTKEQLADADKAQLEIADYFQRLIREKRRRPDDALLSQLANAGSDGDRLSDTELGSMASLLFLAGFETTTNLIGNGLFGLLQQPEQLDRLRADPALIPDLPDEILRYDGTAQMVVRDALADVEIGGVNIPAGSTVFCLLGAGNHDPAEFPNPDAIDVTRKRFRPLSFGGGAHFCLGASLARAETEIVFRSLLERFDSIELRETPRFRDRLTLRGLEALKLAVRPARARDLSRAARPVAAPVLASASASGVAVPAAAAGKGKGKGQDGIAATKQVRPAAGTEADRRWRNAVRSLVESDSVESWLQPGKDLAATIVLLARADLLRGCTSAEISELAATAYPITFEVGEKLTVEGAESLECYVIEEGEADVTIEGKPVRKVGENDVVGERGVLEGSARSATVTATSHMLTYAISRERLMALVERNPDARKVMFEFMRKRYQD